MRWQRLRASTPPVTLCTALALTLLWGVDALWTTGPLDAHVLSYGLCLALAGGALVGALGSQLDTLTRALPRWMRAAMWPLVGGGAGVALAIRLGALGRLKGHYSTTAWLVLAGAALGGVVVGALVATAQQAATPPSAPHGTGMPRRSPSLIALVVSLLLVALTGALFYVDRVLYVGLYPDAHNALRVTAIITLTVALTLWAPTLRIPSLMRNEIALLCLIGSVPIWATWNAESNELHGFAQRTWSLALLRTARAVFDLDRDGASSLLLGGDCNDLNPKVHPLAREIPDNGIDDNCIFGDAQRRTTLVNDTEVPSDPSPLNVVLITVDTLTYNRIGAYDARYGTLGRNTMPNLDAFAKRATVFQQAYAAGGWTSISLASLMRGVWPRKMQWQKFHETSRFRLVPARDDAKLAPDETITKIFPLAWNDPHAPLAAWLKRRGMRTHAVVDDGFSSMLTASVGCNVGFDRYEEVDNQAPHRRNDAGTADLAIAALRAERRAKKPFFLWTHFFGPHTPNETHRRVRVYGDTIPDHYDHEVRYLDEQLGRLLRALHRYRKNTAIFITADHGEAFGKGYRSHGFDLTESMIRVPLIARVPGWPTVRVHTPVSLVDILPTILELTKTPGPPWLDGTPLTRFLREPERRRQRVFYTDTWQYSRKGEAFTDLVAAFDGNHKVVLNRMDQTMQTFVQREKPDTQPATPPADELQLTTRLRAYLEETGGGLQLSD